MQQTRPIFRLEVTSIAAGGDGVAHIDGPGGRRAVFVARSAPGDIVEANVDFSHRPARASALRLLQPSLSRVEPCCPHARACGGCDFMHLSLEAQREAHLAIVRSALEHAVPSVALPPIVVHAAPSALGYRTRARLAVRARAGRVAVGYRRAGTHHLEPVASCRVLDARLEEMLPALGALFVSETGEGDVGLSLGTAGKPVADIVWRGALSGSVFAAVGHLVDGGRLAGAEVWQEGARLPARFGDPRAVTEGADGEPLIVPSGSFAQAHPAMNSALGARVLAAAEPHGSDTVELFAGSGNFTVLLARKSSSLLAVESDGAAVEAARANLRARGLSARIIHADADAFELPSAARTVVLDPPRGGARGAIGRLAQSRVRRIVYVSCDPSTLARDLATLGEGGFGPIGIETFEMFPQTSHVEILVALDRRPLASRRPVDATAPPDDQLDPLGKNR